MDLETTYLGLKLPHPLVCGASPLSVDADMVARLEDAGAAALVMHSLFEEQVVTAAAHRPHPRRDAGARSALGATAPPSPYALPPGRYLEHLLRLKRRVQMPIIASLNGTTPEGWLQYARSLERAGADALELNYYHVATHPAESAQAIEQRLVDIVAVVTESVSIPIAVKLSPFYSSIPNLALRLERIGARGLVLFNRLYQASVDPESRGMVANVQLSDSSDLHLRLHAIAILAGRVHLSLALTGGVHEPIDVVKALMAGADAVQVTSTLLRHGPPRLRYLRRELEKWCDARGYDSLASFKGCAGLGARAGQSGFERDEYRSVLESWNRNPLPFEH